MYKNYFTAFIFIFLSLLLTGISCKKVQTGIPDNSNGSRLTSMSTTYHMPGHTYKILETFVYNANKISHYEKNEDDFLYKISEYTYQNNLAIEKTKLYSETDLVQVDSTIFECNNKKLKRISNWRNSDTLWRLVKDANFLYNGDQEITYLDTLDQTNKEKGTSTFENGKLIQYELCFFSEWINTWSIAYRQDFKYEYGKIKEQIVTTSNNSTKLTGLMIKSNAPSSKQSTPQVVAPWPLSISTSMEGYLALIFSRTSKPFMSGIFMSSRTTSGEKEATSSNPSRP